MFDEDYYYSGGFKICYSEINHIEVEDEVYTSKALVVVCKLMKDEKVIGYDRMVAQDFICLKAKIDEKTKIVKKLWGGKCKWKTCLNTTYQINGGGFL